MLETGLKGTRAMVVTEAESAKHIGSGTVLVLSTPMMIALIEKTCRLSVKPFLEEGQETEGLVGEGTHERFIIDEKKFQSKAESKKNNH